MIVHVQIQHADPSLAQHLMASIHIRLLTEANEIGWLVLHTWNIGREVNIARPKL